MTDVVTDRFSRLKFPVHKANTDSVAEFFKIMPGIRRFFQRVVIDDKGKIISSSMTEEDTPGSYFFNETTDLVKFFKYLIFVYDPNSDLVDEYPGDLRLRKEAAATEAGWSRDKITEDWAPWIKDIFDLKNKMANKYILDYLKVLKNPIWREIVFLSEELDKIYELRISDFQYSIKNKLDEEAKKKNDELALQIKRFYSEHSDLRRETEKEMFPISPENAFAEMGIPLDMITIRQTSDVS